jgi:hypothetical protein
VEGEVHGAALTRIQLIIATLAADFPHDQALAAASHGPTRRWPIPILPRVHKKRQSAPGQ